MNSKHKLYYSLFFVLLITIGVVVFFSQLKNQENTNIKLKEESPKYLRDLEYEEVSPDGLNKIISYHFSFDSSIYRGYYKDYFDNDTVISVRDLEDSKESYIFTGSRLGYPKWIGNDYVFFTSYCGTSCQGIYLVNVSNKKTLQGVLGYMAFEKNRPAYTVFTDWFGHDFKFDGWVDEIRSDTIGGKTYLIFYMRDPNNKVINQKKFLVTGENLKEI